MIFTPFFAVVVAGALPALAVPPAGSRDAGRAGPTTPVSLTFVLAPRREAELRAFADEASNPHSPTFGRFLSDDAFVARYAPAAATYADVRDRLRAAGFALGAPAADRMTLAASAPAPTVERFFATRIDRFATASGMSYANVLPATLPAALRPEISAVVGLDDRARARTAIVPQRGIPGGVVFDPHRGPFPGYGPFVYANAYDFPDRITAGQNNDGRGRTAAIVIDAYPPNGSMQPFFDYYGVARTGPAPSHVDIDGGPANLSDLVEAYLDAESLAGLAGGVKLDLYGTPDLSARHVLDAYAAIVAKHDVDRVDVVDSSFALCETADSSWPKAVDTVALEGVAKGVTFAAATGDSGTAICSNGAGVSAPADVPEFTAVGGTTLQIDTDAVWLPHVKGEGYVRYRSEAAWGASDPQGFTGAAGGGRSRLFAQPAYQASAAPHETMRTLPDISLAASTADPEGIYVGGWGEVATGTSMSTAMFCALVVELAQMHGHDYGNINVALYDALATNGYHSSQYGLLFHDVERGRTWFDSTNPGHRATEGYDLATGIGSIDGANLAKALK